MAKKSNQVNFSLTLCTQRNKCYLYFSENYVIYRYLFKFYPNLLKYFERWCIIINVISAYDNIREFFWRNTMSANLKMLIGETNERAKNIENYFAQRGFSTNHVGCNPFSIQHSAITTQPKLIIMSEKTGYLTELCKSFKSSSNSPYLFIMSTGDSNKMENHEACDFADRIYPADTDSETIYNDLIEFITAQDKNKKSRNDLYNKVSDILEQLCMTPKYLGYVFLREAIMFVVNSGTSYFAISKDIYPSIAKKMNSTYDSVERCMRTAISSSWKKCSYEDKKAYFAGYALRENVVPTNSEYISVISEKIRRRYMM